MSNLNVYLNFMGNTLEVFEFYRSVFGWDFTELHRFSDIPDIPGSEKMSKEDKNWIMHISLPVLSNMILMWTDAIEWMWHKLTMWNNISLSLNLDTKEEALKYFNALSKGWSIEMPLEDTFWWAYYGMCKDKYGINWMVNYQYPKG